MTNLKHFFSCTLKYGQPQILSWYFEYLVTFFSPQPTLSEALASSSPRVWSPILTWCACGRKKHAARCSVSTCISATHFWFNSRFFAFVYRICIWSNPLCQMPDLFKHDFVLNILDLRKWLGQTAPHFGSKPICPSCQICLRSNLIYYCGSLIIWHLSPVTFITPYGMLQHWSMITCAIRRESWPQYW